MNTLARWIIASSALLAGGCATQSQLSQADIDARFPELKALDQALQKADAEEVDLLSRALYEQARSSYLDARKWAAGGSDKAHELAKQAEALLDQANLSTTTAKRELASVLSARDRAMRAGAHSKFPERFAKVDEKMVDYGNMLARGKIADVREGRQALAQQYAQLEVDALKQATAKDAEQRIAEAIRKDADDYAPLTLKQAQAELKLAKEVLESDANARDKAAVHANKALQLANQAIQITELIKEFKQSDMTDEQIVRWYQTQLATAVAPVMSEPDFGQPNRDLIQAIANELKALKNRAESASQALAEARKQHAAELAAKEKELMALRATSEAERERQAQIEARFKAVQSLFSADEAVVYRQGNNVLIRAYGFSFPSGGSEIQSENFPLLKKIIQAIGQFPGSRIEVSGHTDNRGSDELNMRLSTERAEKVARFLTDVGNLPANRVSSKGYGKTRPLASNDTAEGRAANRRVEILIIND